MTTRRGTNSALSRPARSANAARGAAGPGFTLIELLSVIIILSILAAIVVPRWINVGSRQSELEAAAVQRLLTIAAEKTTVSTVPMAVDYDGDKGQFTLWTQREDPKAADDTVGAARVRWQADPLVQPAMLVRNKLKQASADGQRLPQGKWRLAFSPGQPRPVLVLDLAPDKSADGPQWQVALMPDSTSATRAVTEGAASARTPAAASRTVDLDDTGKGTQPW